MPSTQACFQLGGHFLGSCPLLLPSVQLCVHQESDMITVPTLSAPVLFVIVMLSSY